MATKFVADCWYVWYSAAMKNKKAETFFIVTDDCPYPVGTVQEVHFNDNGARVRQCYAKIIKIRHFDRNLLRVKYKVLTREELH